MSSPLDGRIRKLAREEAALALSGQTTDGPPSDLQQQITDLHEHLHHATTTIKRLEDRVDALEKTVTAPATPARRAARKESDDKHP